MVAGLRSPLRTWARGAGVSAVTSDDAEGLRAALVENALEGRGSATPTGAADGRGLVESAAPEEAPAASATVVLVDDVERVAGGPVDDVLCAALDGALGPCAVVAAGSPEDVVSAYRGVLPAMRRSRRALLLHPVPPGAGEVGGVRLPPPRPGPPGRAVLLRGGRTSAVQLACPDAGSP